MLKRITIRTVSWVSSTDATSATSLLRDRGKVQFLTNNFYVKMKEVMSMSCHPIPDTNSSLRIGAVKYNCQKSIIYLSFLLRCTATRSKTIVEFLAKALGNVTSVDLRQKRGKVSSTTSWKNIKRFASTNVTSAISSPSGPKLWQTTKSSTRRP